MKIRDDFNFTPFVPSQKYKIQYQVSTPGIHSYTPQPDLFLNDTNRKKVYVDVIDVLEKEAPISRDLLCRRVLAAWSMGKIGTRISAYFTRLFAQMNLKSTDADKRF